MAISEEEAERLIGHIEETVRRVASDPGMRGITMLIDQWKADVEAGRPVERKLPVRRSPGLDSLTDTPRSRSTTSGDFVGREEYKNVEQLEMLIVSLGLAFLAPPMMSERLLGTIAAYREGKDRDEEPDPVIRLLGVTTADISRPSPPISRETIVQSHESTAELAALLNEIVQEAGFAPRRLMDGENIV